MSISCNALFQCLAEDLSGKIDPRITSFELATRAPFNPDMTYEQFVCLALSKSIFKKFKDHSVDTALHAAAQEKFLASNNRCKDWSLTRLHTSGDEELFGLFKQQVYNFYYSGGALLDSSQSIVDAGKTGPGASIKAKGTDFFTKMFSSPLTGTSEGLLTMYRSGIRTSENWSEAEKLRSSVFGDIDIVPGNKLDFVPKNVDTSRTICVEPSLNMFLQLGVKELMGKRLERVFGIDLSTQQDVNRDLAQIGSVDESYVTIDLESASDSIACSMIRETFPRDFSSWLFLLRSPNTILPDGSKQELHMLSSMGNGFTFPLQTIIYSCIVAAVYAQLNIRLRRSQGVNLGNFGVYGDDIIVVKEAYPRVLRLLDLLGFTVNADKSFFEGPFRESCGGDFYLGRSARGVYIKTLRSQQSRCVAINRLNEWSARTGIPLRSTVRYILKRTRFLPVPLAENDDAGIKVPFSMIEHAVKDRNVQSILYRRHEPKQRYMTITEGDIRIPKGAKKRLYNPRGLLVAFLRGDIERGKIGIRLGSARYYTKTAITPNWDWLPKAASKDKAKELRLKVAITINMC